MKKGILLLITIITLFSCGNNEDNVQSGLIGKWKKTSETKEYQNGEIDEISLSECELKETLEFKSNNQVYLTRYSGVNCEEMTNLEGTYSFNTSNNELTLPGDNKQIVEIIGNDMNFKFSVSGVESYIKTINYTRIE
ncbi:lipocalin family protein [Tenacibaculum geojense]|uniref:Lipocalin family protein n=1 Tax=Tenacibaculum geojense TaxID=915352 RepID=A0ABW3JU05_9FLAO